MNELLNQLKTLLEAQIKSHETQSNEYKKEVETKEGQIKILNGEIGQLETKIQKANFEKREAEKQLKLLEKRF